MKERSKASNILRAIIGATLVGTAVSSCKFLSASGIEKGEVVAPQELLEHTRRLNSGNQLSNFVVEHSNSGELALFFKRRNWAMGIWGT